MAVTRNMNPKKCPMPSQEPDIRNKNFDEVALGYTYDMAVNEAKRCLNCPTKPCRSACPVQIDIPAFIERVANEDMEGAYRVLTASSALPAVCGRVCPQENQCEGKCVRGIKGESVAIGRLERFVADWHREHVADHPQAPAPNGHKVAIIGAGPSGLTAAGDLAKLGYQVTIYEALHLAGGVLVYGIPEFRLPKAIVQKEIDGPKAMGVDIETNMVIGKVLTIDELFEMGYEAVYVASGAGLPRFMASSKSTRWPSKSGPSTQANLVSPPTVRRQPPHMPVPSIIMGFMETTVLIPYFFVTAQTNFIITSGPMAITSS